MSAGADVDHAALRFAAANDAALCTLVGIEGSFSRRLGAQLAIARDGHAVGSLADGCLERELAVQAEAASDTGLPVVLRYGRGSPFIDFRLPCGSGLDILIEPTPSRLRLTEAIATIDARQPVGLDLPSNGPGFLRQRNYIPELRLIVLGNTAEATALARLSGAFGLHVEIVEPGNGLALGRRPESMADAWTAIVLLFHDHEWEREVIEWALSTDALYIGATGGQAARDGRREWLRRGGQDLASIARVRSPVGLIHRARDADVLALSVLAEVVAVYEDRRD